MYIPKAWHWFGPLFLIGAVFALSKRFGLDEFVFFANINFTVANAYLCKYLYDAGAVYQRWQAGEPEQAAEPQKQRVKTNFNNGELVLEQVVDRPVYDMERIFCKTLRDMRNSNLKVDLTEEYWIKGKRWEGSRETFVAFLSRLEKRGGIRRKSYAKTSPYEPNDWRVIRLGAQGERI